MTATGDRNSSHDVDESCAFAAERKLVKQIQPPISVSLIIMLWLEGVTR